MEKDDDFGPPYEGKPCGCWYGRRGNKVVALGLCKRHRMGEDWIKRLGLVTVSIMIHCFL